MIAKTLIPRSKLRGEFHLWMLFIGGTRVLMMTVNIICVGKLKEDYLRDGCSEYIKRLSAHCRLNIIEINECKVHRESQPEIQRALNVEGKRIIERIPEESYSVALCVEGAVLNSMQFADKLSAAAMSEKKGISFIIGGPHGLSDAVKERCGFHFSLSKLTFTHRLARLLMLEQLYRAFSINSSSKYHK